jgi:hypothetical protein
MQEANPDMFSELAPPPKRRTPPSEETDEARGLIESDRVDIEREGPLGENESIERSPPDRSNPPTFEE